MPVQLSKIINNSCLHGIYYFYDSSICFDWDIFLEDINGQHTVKISGLIKNISSPPELKWSIFNLGENNSYCPSKYSYQYGVPDNNLISHWIKSTYLILSPEMLLQSYKLSIKHNVNYLTNIFKWDGLFWERSYFSNWGNWKPSLINPCPDTMIYLLEDEIHFFMSIKKMFYLERKYLKLGKKHKLLPTQIEFMLDQEVNLIITILQLWDKDLWCDICSFLPYESKLFQIWRLEILFYYPDRNKLKKHFLEYNQFNHQI